jgi:hypothetical protein
LQKKPEFVSLLSTGWWRRELCRRTWGKSYGCGDWQARLSVKATVRALRQVWRIETHITAHSGNELVVDRTEIKEYPRDLN